ncbi:hypothetical protein DYI24_14335 [Rhodopseudomonas sp. BR0C11]|uniref:hypothetical protein n=1 Tax=Rhodopseudomonas sp. BR0C11 TaxID=2269370 RepID=UPI0013DED26E|nr:hypothetical protein [Rhodopseudomonas sp. BR0C11]NEV78219.1 hypothetical protein [Rhodopseudomonas sp. BR0C11]
MPLFRHAFNSWREDHLIDIELGASDSVERNTWDGGEMEKFIKNENIRRYRELLRAETNLDKRRVILKLLAEEEAKEIPTKE